MSTHLERRVLESAVCAGCACLCDDIRVTFRDGKAAEVKGACRLGESWFAELRPPEVTALLAGMPASLDDALLEASRLLGQSRSPLILAGGALTTEALHASLVLARECRGTWGPVPSVSLSVERSGIDAPECTATLGEVRGSADLVIFWRSDPQRTHPRHLERYSFFPPLLDGSNRSLLVVDAMSTEENLTLEHAAEVLGFEACPERGTAVDVEIVRSLQLLLEKGETPEPETPLALVVEVLGRRIRESRHTHFFLGEPVADCPALWSLLNRMAARSRPGQRITVSTLLPPGNVRGLLEVPTWFAACPTGMAFREDGPMLVPGSIGGERLLLAGASDLVLLLGVDPDRLGAEAKAALARIRRIVIGPAFDRSAPVCLRTPGLDPRLSAGVVRADGIHLTLNGRPDDERGLDDPTVDLLEKLTSSLEPSPARGSERRAP